MEGAGRTVHLRRSGGCYPPHFMYELERGTARHCGARADRRRGEAAAADVFRRLLHAGVLAVRLGDDAVEGTGTASGGAGLKLRLRPVWNLSILFGDETVGP